MNVNDAIETLKTMPGDEPVFILRGKDSLSIPTIMAWCQLARVALVPTNKILSAIDIAENEFAHYPSRFPD